MGTVYRRAESENFWIRYRDEEGRLCRVSSRTHDEHEAREQLHLIQTRIHLKKRAAKSAELLQTIGSAGNGANLPVEDDPDAVALGARVAYLEHRVKALELLVHEVLAYSDGE